eukprot:2307760-Prymnesium_polylepis.1
MQKVSVETPRGASTPVSGWHFVLVSPTLHRRPPAVSCTSVRLQNVSVAFAGAARLRSFTPCKRTLPREDRSDAGVTCGERLQTRREAEKPLGRTTC